MMHETAVLTLDFSRDSDYLASGCANGKIKVCGCSFTTHHSSHLQKTVSWTYCVDIRFGKSGLGSACGDLSTLMLKV